MKHRRRTRRPDRTPRAVQPVNHATDRPMFIITSTPPTKPAQRRRKARRSHH